MDEEALDQIIRERLAANGQESPTDDEIDEVREKVRELLVSGKAQRLTDLVKEGKAGEEMRVLNLSLGIKGGETFYKALVRGAPNLSEERKNHLIRTMTLPPGLQPGHFGAQEITVSTPNGVEHKFALRCGEATEGYSLSDELQKVDKFISTQDATRLTEQASYLFLFARTAYVELLEANPKAVETLGKRYGTSDRGLPAYSDFLPDSQKSTLALAAPLRKEELKDGTKRRRLSPEIGIFLDRLSAPA